MGGKEMVVENISFIKKYKKKKNSDKKKIKKIHLFKNP